MGEWSSVHCALTASLAVSPSQGKGFRPSQGLSQDLKNACPKTKTIPKILPIQKKLL